MRYFPRRMAGANGLSTAATGLADLWPLECAAAAAKLNPGWNKKKLGELLTNRISLDIFGYKCGATTQNDIIVVGALYGYCRIIAKLFPGEAARMTIKMFTEAKQTEKPNEQEKTSNT